MPTELNLDHATCARLSKPKVRLIDDGAVVRHEDVVIVYHADLNLHETDCRELPKRIQDLIPTNLNHTRYRIARIAYQAGEALVHYRAYDMSITRVTQGDVTSLYAGCLTGARIDLPTDTAMKLMDWINSPTMFYQDHINHKASELPLVNTIDTLAAMANRSVLCAILPVDIKTWGFIITRDNLYAYQYGNPERTLVDIYLIDPKTDLFAEYPPLDEAFLSHTLVPRVFVTTKLPVDRVARTLAGIHGTASEGELRRRLTEAQGTTAPTELSNTSALKAICRILGPISSLSDRIELLLLNNQLTVSSDSSDTSITLLTTNYKIKFTAVRKPRFTRSVVLGEDRALRWMVDLWSVTSTPLNQFTISRSLVGQHYYAHSDLGYTLLIEATKQ